MPDEQQPPVDAEAGHRIERQPAVKSAGQRRVGRQQRTLIGRPRHAGELGRLARSHLRAEENGLEGASQPPDRLSRRRRLRGATLGQSALGVLASPMRLGLCVSK